MILGASKVKMETTAGCAILWSPQAAIHEKSSCHNISALV